VLETNILSAEKDWFSRPGESVLSAMRRRAVTAEMLANQLDGGLDEFRGIIAGTIQSLLRLRKLFPRLLGARSDSG
jgi:hypothetical protein